MNRSGVALIIAISVLAALLFLALPFVFSQSASVAGARAASWDGASRRGSDRSLGLATALSTYATALHRSPGLATQLSVAQLTYVQLPGQIGDFNGPIRYPSDAPNSWRSIIATGEPWSTTSGVLAGPDSAGAVHGATIEDESRRIEPNCLDMYGWAVVLKRAGIQDPWTVAWHWDLTKPNKGVWTKVTFGRLARALTYWRPGNGSRRFNRLEDMLGADPQQPENWYGVASYLGCVHFGPLHNYPSRGQSGWPPGLPGQANVEGQAVEGTRNAAETDPEVKFNDDNGNGKWDAGETDTDNLGWRVAPLTQAELERLRPLLSFLIPGQGRSGLIDLGTVVAAENRSGDWWGVVTDELSPPDTGMVGGAIRTNRTWTHSGTASNRHLDNGWAREGDPLAVDAIPALNLNTVPSDSGMTRLYLAQDYATGESDGAYQARIEALNWPNDPIDTPITTIGHMPLLRWLDPRTGDGVIGFERPPLGIAGFGIVAVEGLATIRDAQGNAVASRRRRTVVQAVPQERPIEAAWITQGDFEGLVRLRHGSWVVAGPHPTNRISDWGADGSTGRQDMLALDGPGWLEPAPLTSFGRNPSIDISWRVPFGLTGTQTWADILMPVNASGVAGGTAPVVQPSASLRSSGTAVGALTAQGLRLDPGDRIAYADGGPLTFTTNGDELGAGHVSLRFCLPEDPSGTTVIAEVRNQLPGRDTKDVDDVDFGKPDARTESQSLWRIEYRHNSSQLVLVLANAALPWTASDRTRFGVAAWTAGTDVSSADFDARCRPGVPFAPALPDPYAEQAVEFRYQVAGGLQKGRWYHLQAVCASDRPGLHGLILDGVVGRDATQAGVDMARTGDHYTYPSLRLATAIDMVVPGDPLKNPATELTTPMSGIMVRFPANVSLAALLPEPGMIRIDDEYISYTTRTDNGGGTGTLTGIQRARRVNTNQISTEDQPPYNGRLDSTEDLDADGVLDPGEDANGNGRLDSPEDLDLDGVLDITSDVRRWPVTQRHEVGAIVTPGWAQARLASGRWLRGSAHLAKPMQALPAEGVVRAGWPTGLGDPVQRDINPPIVTLDTQSGTWPDKGIVAFEIGAQTHRAAFTAAGTTLTLDWAGPGTNGVPAEFAAGTDISCRVVSIEVDGLFPVDRLVQLLSTIDGRCEWIRVDEQADRTGQTVDGMYFIFVPGWSMTGYGTPQPLVQPRGAMRTGWDSGWTWPANTTLVLPVQTLFDADRFESGDVVTFVPDTINDPPVSRFLPVQAVVRHACRDGYPTTQADSGAKWDTRNEWFALAHAVPSTLLDPVPAVGPPNHLRALVGRGWGGDDLSPEANSPQRRGSLPRLNLLIQTDGAKAKIHFGGADTAAGSTANTGPVVLDDLCAGPLPGGADANGAANAGSANGCEVIEIGGSDTGTMTALASALPVQVRATKPVFALNNARSMYGMVLIDGEAFAFRRLIIGGVVDDTQAELIARAMLGTAAAPHALAGSAPTVPLSGATRTIRPTLPIVALPVGPVAELCSPLAAGAHNVGIDVVETLYANYYKDPVDFTHPSQDSYANDPHLIMRPPFVLCHDPADGDTVEVMRLFYRPASTQRITARWLRGVYGTTDTSWSAPYTPSTHVATWSSTDPGAQPVTAQPPGRLNPIMIGWWPRFAPGQTGSPPVEALRSRSFSWAGFALRLSGSRFDPYGVPALKSAVGGIADVGVAADGGCTVTASALAAEEATGVVFDWDKAWLKRVSLSQSANAGLTDPFNWDRFQLREADGAELRIHWAAPTSAATGLLRAADASGRTPRLENVRLRCVAPNRVLAVEEVR